MDLLVTEPVLEFGSSLREALDDAIEWARGVGPIALRIARQRQEGLRLPRCLSSGRTTQGSGGAGLARKPVVGREHGRRWTEPACGTGCGLRSDAAPPLA